MSRSLKRMVSLLAPLRIYRLGQESLIDAELAAYSAALEPLEELLDQVRQNAFVQLADDGALRRYERMVGLPERRDVAAERRREFIIYRLSVAPFDFTARKMQGSVRAAGIEAELVEDIPEQRLEVRTTALIDPTLNMEVARLRLDALLPAHLEWELDFGTMTWEDFERADPRWNGWDSLEFTWDQFDIDGRAVFAPLQA